MLRDCFRGHTYFQHILNRLKGSDYKPLIRVRGSCSHRVRPQSKESKGEVPTRKGRWSKKNFIGTRSVNPWMWQEVGAKNCKLLRKSINGLYRFERFVVIDLSRLNKNSSIKAIWNDKFDKNDAIKYALKWFKLSVLYRIYHFIW